MDGVGLLIIVIGGCLYFLAKDKPKLREFSVLLGGVGLGLVIGAFWAASMVAKAFGG